MTEESIQSEVTNSERKAAACPQRWLWRYGLGLEAEAQTHAMRVGTLVHAGLETLMPDRQDPLFSTDPTLARSRAFRAIEAEADKVLAESQTAGSVVDPSKPSVDAEAVERSVAEAKALMDRYLTRWGVDGGFETLHTELVLRTNAIVPETGRKSPRTIIASKLDRIAKIHGRHWLVEHKTTRLSLEDWHRQHRYDPQAPTYAWIARQELGIEIAGVCYDLILRDVPLRAEELDVTKPTKAEPNGRLYKPKPGSLPRTTAVEFLAAVHALGQTLDDVDWYRECFIGLRNRDDGDYWFRREFEPFAPGAIDRVGDELYYAGTRIRRWRELLAPHRARIVAEAMNTGGRAGEAAHAAVRELGAQFERNPAMCRAYNRPCSYAIACELHTLDSVRQLKVRPKLHSELEDEDTDD